MEVTWEKIPGMQIDRIEGLVVGSKNGTISA